MGVALAVATSAAVSGVATAGMAAHQRAKAAKGAAAEARARADRAEQSGLRGEEAAKRGEALSLPTPREIMALENTLRTQEQTIQREQKLIEAVDPALMEAGRQAFQMLQGKETEMLAPIRRQRERQMQQMKETLRRQLGPGFETSSAGIEAMTRFEMETSDLLAQTQQNAVNSLLGFSQNAATMGRQTEANATQGMLNTTGIFGQLQERAMRGAQGVANAAANTGNLINGGSAGLNAANSAVASQAGAGWDVASQGFGQVAKFAGMAYGQGAMAGGTPATSTAQAAPGLPGLQGGMDYNSWADANMPKK